MSGSDAENRRPGKGADLASQEAPASARTTVVPYNQVDWAVKLRQARTKRSEALEQRGIADQPAPLVRPEARPPFSPPAGQLPPGFDPTMAPVEPAKRWFDPVDDPAARHPAPRPKRPVQPDPVPAATEPAALRSQHVAKALGRITGRNPDITGPRTASHARNATARPERDRRPGVQVLAAFAMGLGVGVPLATVAWLSLAPPNGSVVVADDEARLAAAGNAATSAPPANSDQIAGRPPATTLTVVPTKPAETQAAAPAGPPGSMTEPANEGGAIPSPVLAAASTGDASVPLTADGAGFLAPGDVVGTGSETMIVGALERDPASPISDLHTVVPETAGEAALQPVVGSALETARSAPAEVPTVAPTARPTSRPTLAPPEPQIAEMAGPLPNGRVIGQDSQVRVYAPSRVPSGQMNAIASELRQSGATVIDPVRTRLTIQDTHVRYYHPGDAEEARAVAARVGAEARDFTSFSPSPPEGMLELWVAGRGSSGPSRSARPNDPVAEVARDLGGALSRLFSSIPPSDPQH